ncbi:unnamed protein product, partial [Nippostrongylus brasiliensis]|uniref:Ig-like domain-containing protein n=1 Tax=Nippostrongylus brasiliensis TaxID=27835 RepID=A0A0N4YMC7_NIPBR
MSPGQDASMWCLADEGDKSGSGWDLRGGSLNSSLTYIAPRRDSHQLIASLHDRVRVVTSRCLLRTNSLTMTGNYRCQATTSEQKSKAISSEIGINVVGIEKISMVNYHLPFGKIGHVEVEICANPKPEIFWLVPDAII